MTGLGFKKPAGLGVSVEAVLSGLNVIIPFAPAYDGSPIEGQPRSFCKSENGLNTLELIGEPRDLQSVSLVTATTEDAIANLQNSTLMIKLLQVIIPQWKDQDAWLKSAANRIGQGSAKTNKHGKLVSLSCPSLGVLILNVSG